MAEKGETLEDSRRLDVPSGGCSGRLPIDLDKGRARHVSRLPVDGGDDGVHQGLKVRDDPHRHGSNRIGLAHGFGTNLSDLFSHSWRRVPVSSRCWIPKHSRWASSVFSLGEVKSTDLGLGARVVRRVQEPEPLLRSFVEVVRERVMDRGRGRYPHRFGMVLANGPGENAALRGMDGGR